MSITQRIVLIVAVLGIAVAVVAGMGCFAILNSKAATEEVNDRVLRALALGQLERNVRDVELAAGDGRRANSRTDAATPLATLADAVRRLNDQLARDEFAGARSPSIPELLARVNAFAAERAGLGHRFDYSLAGSAEGRDQMIDAAAGEMESLLALFDLTRSQIRANLDASRAARDAHVSRVLVLLGVVTSLALVAGLAVALVIARHGLVGPLQGVTGAIKRLAGGDLAAPVAEERRTCEVGELWRATATLREALRSTEATRRKLRKEAEDRDAPRGRWSRTW